jgi:hypothetical protein
MKEALTTFPYPISVTPLGASFLPTFTVSTFAD